MRYDHDPKRQAVPDYTVPALVMLGVNLFLGLAVLWFNFGLGVPLLLALVMHLAIGWQERRAQVSNR